MIYLYVGVSLVRFFFHYNVELDALASLVG